MLAQWISELEYARKLSEKEILRHKLLFIAKLLHECQHQLTNRFVSLPRVSSKKQARVGSSSAEMAFGKSAAEEGWRKRSRDKDPSGSSGDGGFATHSRSELESRDGGPAMHTRSKAEPPDVPETGRATKSMRLQTPSPSSTQTEVGDSHQNTPENVGSSRIHGRPCGDSGNARAKSDGTLMNTLLNRLTDSRMVSAASSGLLSLKFMLHSSIFRLISHNNLQASGLNCTRRKALRETS